jgi:hypothetical protein
MPATDYPEGEKIVSRVILGIVIGLALGAAGAITLVKYPQVAEYLKLPEAEKAQEPEAAAEESFLQRDPNGQTAVKLDQEAQTHMGLKVVSLAAATAPSEVKAFGRVLDPTPLVALVAERASAQTALQASAKEYERVKTLYAQDQNASARALETAEAAMSKDQIAVESVQLRLLAGWGKEVAPRADLPALLGALAARQAALIRVDVPIGAPLKALPVGARIAPVSMPENVMEAQILGPAPTTDPQAQSEGYLLLVKTDALAPGAALAAWLAAAGQPRSGVIVPRDAVLRHEGETFVYLQRINDVFQRQAVALERPGGGGWFVAQGLKPQEKVVIVGAQELLSEELKGQGAEE